MARGVRPFLALLYVVLAASCLRAAQSQTDLDRAVAKLGAWETPSAERSVAADTIRKAGSRAAGHVRALLKSTCWMARREGLSLAANAGVPDLGRLVAQALADRNWAVRVGAAKLAAALPVEKRSAAEGPLKSLLKDQIAKVRLAAYKALARWRPQDGYMSNALADRDSEVSYWAAQEYMQRARSGSLSPEVKGRLVDSIIAKLKSTRWQKMEDLGVATLLLLGPGAQDALYDAVTGERAEVRARAVSTIGARAGKAGVTLMFRFMNDADRRVQANAITHIAGNCEERDAPRLLRLLASAADWQIRRNVLEALGRLKYRPAVPRLIRLLSHHDYNLRRGALTALGQIGDKSVAPKLIGMYRSETQNWRRSQLVRPIAQLLGDEGGEFLNEAIRDDDRSVRTYALYAARSYLKDDEKLKILLRVIAHEENDSVRQSAISSLNGAQAAKAAEALIEALRRGGPQTRRAAAHALSGVGSGRAIKALIDAYAGEEDASVREALVTSLGRVNDRRVMVVLKRALNSQESGLRGAALNALARLEDGLTDQLLVRVFKNEDDENVLRSCVSLIRSRHMVSPQLLPRLVKLMDSADNGLRRSVVGCISRIESVEAARALCQAIKGDSYAPVRTEAMGALARLLKSHKVAVSAITGSLQDALTAEDEKVRELLVKALSDLADPSTRAVLMKVVTDDSSDRVRRSATVGIGRVAHRDMVPALLKASEAEEDAGTLIALIQVLGELGDRRALPFLKKSLRAPESSVQAAALRAIGSFTDASLIPFYVERFRLSTSVEVRLTSLRSISGSGDRRALDVLMQAVKAEDPRMVQAAIGSLVEFADVRVVSALAGKLFEGERTAQPTDAVLDLLGRTRLKAVTDRLLASARKEEDAARLRALYQALGKVRDRRAVPLLADAVKSRRTADLTVAAIRSLVELEATEHGPLCLDVARSSLGRVSNEAMAAAARLGPGEQVMDSLEQWFAGATVREKRDCVPLLALAGRRRAAGTLTAELGRSSDVPLLTALCASVASLRGTDTKGLRQVALADVGDATATTAIEALAEGGGAETTATLEQIVNSNRAAPVRAAALEAYARRRMVEARGGDIRALRATVLKFLTADEPDLRGAAARVAGQSGLAGPELAKALVSVAEAALDADIRVAAVRSLGRMHGSREAEAALLRMVEASEREAELPHLARALGSLGTGAATKKLVEMSRTGNVSVRVAAVETLGGIAEPSALAAVTQALGDPHVDKVRAAAATALARHGGRRHVARLAKALADAPGLDVRVACARALGRLGGKDARAALVKALSHDSGWIREAAVRALAKMATGPVRSRIQELVQDVDVGVAAAAREALRATGHED